MYKYQLLILIFCFSYLEGALDPIEEQISNSPFSSAYWAFHVVREDTGETVYSLNGSKNFVPASTTKLFTAALALEALGEQFTYRTSVFTRGVCVNGVVKGDLILHGEGDPTLTTASLGSLARKIRSLGIQTIQGQVILDPACYMEERFFPHAEYADLMWYFAPEMSMLAIDDNAVILTIDENKQILLEQKVPYCHIHNYLSDDGKELTISRGISDNIITLTGSPSSPVKERIALHYPEEYARRVFMDALEKEGIIIQNQRFETSAKNSTPMELAYMESEPLKAIVKRMNKESNNLIAEMLLRTVGLRAKTSVVLAKKEYEAQNGIKGTHTETERILSWAKNDLAEMATKGLEQQQKLLEKMGISANSYHFDDGSGLSRKNLVTPETEVKLLAYMLNTPMSESFINSLPIGGVDGGLKDRFKENIYVRAKTGSLSHVRSLAGYATSSNGKKFLFACHVNHYGQDKGCIELLDHLLTQIINRN